MNSSAKAIILGLDGASWTVLDPFLNSGRMPNLQRIISMGTSAVLNSIIPPVTGPAWPVLASGLNPGRLGIFDFQNRRSLENFNLYPVNSGMIRGRSFWDALSESGYRLGIFGYPMLIPTYPIEGWMIAGLGASKLQDWVWPPTLARELHSVANPYTISISYGLPKYRGDQSKLLADLSNQVDGQLASLEYLLGKYPVDVLVAVFGVTDVLSHTMWHLWDQSHPLHSNNLSAQLLPLVHSLWSKIDAGIGMLSQHLDSDGHLLLVSDHGFGPSYGVFHTNVWLQQYGFLRKRSGMARMNNSYRSHLVSLLFPFMNPVLRKLQGTPAQFVLRESILREIDLEHTKAFALETTDITGMIFINRAYACSRGLNEEQFVHDTAQEIRKRLDDYAHHHNLKIDVYLAEELYQGEFTQLAPELLYIVNDSEVSVSHKFASDVFQLRLHHPMKTGNHRLEGVFIGYGSKIKNGLKLQSPLHLLDIAPTIYHLLSEPIPPHLDGEVVLDVLLPEHRHINVVSSESQTFSTEIDENKSCIEDPDDMKQRLKDLGYLD